MAKAPPLGAEGHPRLTPGAFLVSFWAHKKKLAVRRNLTVSFAAVKRNGGGKYESPRT